MLSTLLRLCVEMRYGFARDAHSESDHFESLWLRNAEMESVRIDDIENVFALLAKCVIERRDGATPRSACL